MQIGFLPPFSHSWIWHYFFFKSLWTRPRCFLDVNLQIWCVFALIFSQNFKRCKKPPKSTKHCQKMSFLSVFWILFDFSWILAQKTSSYWFFGPFNSFDTHGTPRGAYIVKISLFLYLFILSFWVVAPPIYFLK